VISDATAKPIWYLQSFLSGIDMTVMPEMWNGECYCGPAVFFCFVFEGLLNIYWNLEIGPTATI
jgi:hypothetical protein